jgi:hypothetical protein
MSDLDRLLREIRKLEREVQRLGRVDMAADKMDELMVGDVGGGNYALIDEDGVHLVGTTTVWLDEKGQLSGAKLVSPSSKVVQDDAEGGYYYKDTATTADYIWVNIQLNHDRKHGVILSPHLHWWQGSATVPNWLLEYRYQKQGAAKTTSWSSAAWSGHAFVYTAGTLCQITDFPDITPPSGDGVSDVLQVRVVRDTGNASGLFGGVDGLVGNVYIYDFDVHKEVDGMGSKGEYVK